MGGVIADLFGLNNTGSNGGACGSTSSSEPIKGNIYLTQGEILGAIAGPQGQVNIESKAVLKQKVNAYTWQKLAGHLLSRRAPTNTKRMYNSLNNLQKDFARQILAHFLAKWNPKIKTNEDLLDFGPITFSLNQPTRKIGLSIPEAHKRLDFAVYGAMALTYSAVSLKKIEVSSEAMQDIEIEFKLSSIGSHQLPDGTMVKNFKLSVPKGSYTVTGQYYVGGKRTCSETGIIIRTKALTYTSTGVKLKLSIGLERTMLKNGQIQLNYNGSQVKGKTKLADLFAFKAAKTPEPTTPARPKPSITNVSFQSGSTRLKGQRVVILIEGHNLKEKDLSVKHNLGGMISNFTVVSVNKNQARAVARVRTNQDAEETLIVTTEINDSSKTVSQDITFKKKIAPPPPPPETKEEPKAKEKPACPSTPAAATLRRLGKCE